MIFEYTLKDFGGTEGYVRIAVDQGQEISPELQSFMETLNRAWAAQRTVTFMVNGKEYLGVAVIDRKITEE